MNNTGLVPTKFKKSISICRVMVTLILVLISISFSQAQVTPSVVISSNATNNSLCRGTAVTFTATPTNGGATPTYQWKRNGTNIFTGSQISLYNLQVNDQIRVVMTTSLTAAEVSSTTATSNTITLTVNNLPSVVSTTPAFITSCTAAGSATINAVPTTGSVIDWYASTSSTTPLLTSSNSYTTPSISSTTTYYPVARDTVTGCQSNGLTAENMAINMGPNNAYIQTPKTVTGSFTIEFWLKTAGSSSAGCASWRCGEGLVDANTSDASDYDFGITMYNDYVAFGMGNGSGNPDFSIVTTTLINNRRWKHIAASWDSTTGAMKLYVNGNLEASAIGSTASRNGQSLMRLGSLLQAPGNGFYGYFSGNLDEVRVWRKVRTQAEIQSNYTNNLNGREDGLAQYYNFNQGIPGNLYNATQTTLLDITPNGYNGSLNQFMGLGLSSIQGNWWGTFDLGFDPAKYPVVVTKFAIPTVTSTTGATICGSSGTTTLTAATSAGAKIDWYANATGGTALAIGTSNFTTPTLSATTTYYAEARDTVTGCFSASRTAVTATVGAIPTAGITNNTGSTVLTCTRTSISVTATGGSTYSWSNSLGSSANASITAAGTYTVTVTSAVGCQATSSITVTRDATAPTAGITNNTGSTVITCTTTAISVTATGGVTYSWNNGLGNSANASITAAGTYTVTVTGANGCTATSSITTTQNNPAPSAGITNNTGATILTCSRTSISVTATGGVSYSWNNSLGSSASASITSPGTYTVTVTGANACTATSSITVTQDITAPTAGITNNTGSTILTCSRTAISVTATGGSSYSWSNSLGNSASASITSPGTYTVTVTGANGCTSTASITITQNITAPTAGITNNTGSTILTCSRTAISVTATGGSSYSWSNSLGNSASASITSPGTYTVTVTGANGCTSTSSITVTQDITAPTAGITNNTGSTILTCTRTSISVTATGLGSYSWSNSLGSSAAASITSPGTFTVTVTGANGCTSTASITATQNITIPSAPVVTNGSRCGDGTVTLSATSGTGTVVDWYASATSSSPFLTASNTYTTTSLSSSTNYYLISRDTATGCTSAKPRVTNALNFDGINDFVNAGNGTSLKINRGTIEAWIKTGNAGSQYRAIVCKQYAFGLFLNNNVLVAYDWNNLNQISTGINLADNSWHHVALSFDAGPNVHTANIYIDSILRAQANFYISNQNDSMYIGKNTGSQQFTGNIDEVRVWNVARTQSEIGASMNSELSGRESGLVAYYNFNQGVAGGTNTSITSLTDLTSNSNNASINNFTLTGNASNFVNGPTLTPVTVVTANVQPLPTVASSQNGSLICGIGTTSLSATASAGAKIDWYAASTGGATLVTGSNIYTTPTISATTIYYAEARDTVTGCVSGARTAVTALVGGPTAGITNNTGSTILTCSRTAISVTATGGTSYSWSNSLGSSATASITSPGTFTVTVTGANGCTATSSITVTSDAIAPTAGITNNTGSTVITCTTTAISVTATGGASYSWSNSLGTSANVSITAPGTYTVTVTGSNGCTAISSITVTSDAIPPTAGITNNTGSTILNCTTTAISVTATGGASYSWNNSLGSSSNASITAPGIYTVTATGANGCTSTANITVTQDITVPTASIENNPLTTELNCYTQSINLTAGNTILESFSNGLWNTSNFTLGAPSFGNGSVVNGAYTDPTDARTPLRTVNQFHPDANHVLTVSATIKYTNGLSIGFIATRSSGTILNANTEPDGAKMRLHNFNDGQTTLPNGVNEQLTTSFYNNPVRVTMIDNGTSISCKFINLVTLAERNFTVNTSSSNGDYIVFSGGAKVSWDDIQISYGNSNISYVWVDGSGTSLGTSASTTITTPGTYTITATGANGCTATSGTTITQNIATSTGDTTAVACNSFTWYGTTYTSSANPTRTFVNANGCDSVVTAHIVINYSTTSSFNDTACNTLTLPWGQTVTISGNYNHTYQAVNGCDSVVTANIVINYSTTSQFNDTACNSLTLPWSQIVTTSGNYNHTYQKVNGCDSVVTANIVINYSTTSQFNDTACNSLTLPWSQVVTTSGNYNHTYQTVNGCDSVVTAHIVINYSTTSSFNDTACNTLTLPWSQVVTTSGNYNHTYQTVNGCDSVVTANIVINYSTSSSFKDTACNTLSLPWSQVVTTSGNYNHTYQTVNGCDSVVTAHIIINYSTTSQFNDTACNTLSLPWSQIVTSSGNYNHTYQTVNGCDSVVTAHIVINYSTTSSFNDTACNTLTLPWSQVVTTSGNYNHTYQTVNGCDSVVTANIVINYSITSSFNDTACNSLTLPWSQIVTTSGSYNHTYQTVNGCDSVVTANIIINYSTTSSFNDTACNTLTLPWSQIVTTSGNYNHTYQTVKGCDSVVTAHIVINYSTTSQFNDTSCNSLSLPWSQVVTTSGNYNHTYQTVNGCDSVVTAHIVIKYSTSSSYNDTACNTLTLPWGTVVTTSGSYNHTYQAVNGCDSLVTANIVINYGTHNTTNQSACATYTWNGTAYTQSGTYTYAYANASGCASVDTLRLTVNPLPASAVAVNGTRCGTGTVALSATVSSGNTVDWYTATSGGTALSTGTSSFTTPSISTTTDFYAVARNTTTGCMAALRTSVNALVNPLPASAVGVDGSRYGTGTVSLSATVSSGITVDWYAAATGGTALSTGSTSFTTPSISSTTIYYAQARNTITGCVSATRTAVTATVNAILVVGVSLSSNTTNNRICRGTGVTFTATPTNGGSTPTYQWRRNGTILNYFGGQEISLYNIQVNDQISVVMTTSLSAAIVTNTTATSNAITLTVNNLPSVVSTTPAFITSCATAGSATINAIPTTGSVIDWYASTSSTTPLLTSSNSYTTPNISTTTTYYPVARDTVTGCQSNGLTAENMAINMGPNNAYIQTPKTVTGSFTIEFWFKPGGSSSAGCGSWRCGEGLVDASTGDPNDRDFGINIFNDYVAFGMGNGAGNPDVSILSTTYVGARRWKHIAASWDSTTGAMKLYVNGNLEASATGGTGSRNGQSLMRLGALLQAPGNGYYGYFSGSLDEVRVWSKVRTQTEIQSNYTNNLNGREDGLAQYYNFNQGIPGNIYNNTQTTLYDITPNGYNGSLNQFMGLGTGSIQGNWWGTFDLGFAPAKYPVVVTKIVIPTVTSTTGATICGSSGTTTLTATASAGAKIDWYADASGGTALAIGTSNFTTPTLSATTTYYAEARDTIAACVSTTRTAVTATIGAIPTAGITNNTGSTVLTCTRTSISLTATGGVSYSWSNSLGSSANASITAAGTYTVTVTSAVGCQATSSITVTRDVTAPTAGITNNTGSTVVTCTTTAISVTATGGVSYSWNNGLGTSANASITAAGTYTVTVTGANGCTATSSITTTQNNTAPAAGITNNTGSTVLTCSRTSISVTATGGVSYSWNNGLGSSANASITAPGINTVTITGANGCTSTSSITVTQDNTAFALSIINNPLTSELNCNTQSINLNATSTIFENFNNGQWNTANFTLGAPSIGNGSVVNGAYTDPTTSRTPLRTVKQFHPDSNHVLTVSATIKIGPTYNMGFIATRSNGTIFSAGEELVGAKMRIHNFSNGITGFADGYQALLADSFYFNPVRITMTDNGTSIIYRLVNLVTLAEYNYTAITTASNGDYVTFSGGQATSWDDIQISYSNPYVSYNWINGNGVSIGNSASTSITTPGTYTVTASSANGCTTTASVAITQNISTSAIDTSAFACNSFTWYGTTYTNSATPTKTFRKVNGCDSIITLHLTVGHSNTGDTTAVACNSFTWYGTTYTSSANPTRTFTNASGCDSVVTLHLTITSVANLNATTVTGTKNVCAYIGTNTPVTYTASCIGATSYAWTLPPNIILVSGQGTANISVKFLPGFAANANKQFRVVASSPCGASPIKVFYTLAQTPVTPAAIIASTANVCPSIGTNVPIIFTIPRVAEAGNSSIMASSYLWTAQSGTTTITRLSNVSEYDTSIAVTFANNFTSSNITVQAINQCGLSPARSYFVSRNNPSTPSLISGPTNACEYSGATGVNAIYSVTASSNVDSYTWTLPAGVTNVSGQGTNTITFRYPAGFAGGSISVIATNGCGTSNSRSMVISRLVSATPGNIDVINPIGCPNRVYTYSISSLPGNATATEWTVPTGGTIVSGQGTISISVSYITGVVDGLVTVRGINNCGASSYKTSIVKLAPCPAGPTAPTTKALPIVVSNPMEVKVFPNPTTNIFSLQVITADQQEVVVRILDVQGRFIKSVKVDPYQTVSIGSELKSGSYLLEVKQGNSVKTTRVVKY